MLRAPGASLRRSSPPVARPPPSPAVQKTRQFDPVKSDSKTLSLFENWQGSNYITLHLGGRPFESWQGFSCFFPYISGGRPGHIAAWHPVPFLVFWGFGDGPPRAALGTGPRGVQRRFCLKNSAQEDLDRWSLTCRAVEKQVSLF